MQPRNAPSLNKTLISDRKVSVGLDVARGAAVWLGSATAEFWASLHITPSCTLWGLTMV